MKKSSKSMTMPSPTPKITFPLDTHQRVSISIEIEQIYNRCPETSYLEAIAEWSEANDVEPELVPRCLAEALLQKLTAEVSAAKLIKSETIRVYSLDMLM